MFIIVQRNDLEGHWHWRCHKDREKIDYLFFLIPLGVFINQINVLGASKVNDSFHYLNIWHA